MGADDIASSGVGCRVDSNGFFVKAAFEPPSASTTEFFAASRKEDWMQAIGQIFHTLDEALAQITEILARGYPARWQDHLLQRQRPCY